MNICLRWRSIKNYTFSIAASQIYLKNELLYFELNKDDFATDASRSLPFVQRNDACCSDLPDLLT